MPYRLRDLPFARTIMGMRAYGGLLAVFLLACLFSPRRHDTILFLDLGNLTDILRQSSEKGILAVGMTFAIVSGGIDLSVGSILALSATASALLLMHHGAAALSILVLALVTGAGLGALNGGIIARARMQPFIVTLATMSAVRGLARFLSGGAGVPLAFGPGAGDPAFQLLGGRLSYYMPIPALIFVLAIITGHLLLAHTSFGRHVFAIGGNEEAARLSGIRVEWAKVAVYGISGFLSALAGVIHCAQLEQGNPNDGVAYELDAIASVVIGGTSLAGGSGSVIGTMAGALIIGIINNVMGLNNVDSNIQLILKGVIIVGAVWLQRRR
jgi:ribose transport system permease protein